MSRAALRQEQSSTAVEAWEHNVRRGRAQQEQRKIAGRDERPEPSRSRPKGNTASIPFQGKEMNFPWKGKQIFRRKAKNSEFFIYKLTKIIKKIGILDKNPLNFPSRSCPIPKGKKIHSHFPPEEGKQLSRSCLVNRNKTNFCGKKGVNCGKKFGKKCINHNKSKLR